MRELILGPINLNRGLYHTGDVDIFGSPVEKLDFKKLPRFNKSRLTRKDLEKRRINIPGSIFAKTQDDCDNALDDLKALMLQGLLTLSISFKEGFRRWDVVVKNIAVTRKTYQVSTLEYVITCFAPNPIGYSLVDYPFIDTLQNQSLFANYNVKNIGSYFAQPEITIELNEVEPNNQARTIRVGAGVDAMQITQVFNNGDNLFIDCRNLKTTLNDTEIPVKYPYPKFARGDELIISSDFDRVNFNISANYNPQWL